MPSYSFYVTMTQTAKFTVDAPSEDAARELWRRAENASPLAETIAREVDRCDPTWDTEFLGRDEDMGLDVTRVAKRADETHERDLERLFLADFAEGPAPSQAGSSLESRMRALMPAWKQVDHELALRGLTAPVGVAGLALAAQKAGLLAEGDESGISYVLDPEGREGDRLPERADDLFAPVLEGLERDLAAGARRPQALLGCMVGTDDLGPIPAFVAVSWDGTVDCGPAGLRPRVPAAGVVEIAESLRRLPGGTDRIRLERTSLAPVSRETDPGDVWQVREYNEGELVQTCSADAHGLFPVGDGWIWEAVPSRQRHVSRAPEAADLIASATKARAGESRPQVPRQSRSRGL